MPFHRSIVALVLALTLAVGCKPSRRPAAPVAEHATTAPTSSLPSGTCGDSRAPLRAKQAKVRQMLEVAKTMSPEERRERAKRLRDAKMRRLDVITIEDGIDEDEAYTIAQTYFEMHLGDCGEPLRPTKDGRSWTSVVSYGLVGDLLPTRIKIDARSGAVQGPQGPSYNSLAAFRSAWSARSKQDAGL